MDYKKYTLKNGLRVVLIPMKDMTTATTFTIVGTGSRYENEKENGLAHFLEHMFFKGTKKRLDAMKIARELDTLGAKYNAYTGQTQTAYFAKVSSEKILDAMDVMHDLYLNATLEAEEIKKESGTIVQEINMYEDMPSSNVHNEFEKLLYGEKHPLGRPILGSKKNVLNFKRKDFVEYLERCYSAKNTVVVVAGNFPQSKVIAKIEEDFGSMESGEKPICKLFKKTQNKPNLLIKQKKTDQTHLLLGVHTPGYLDKNKYAISILTSILGGGMSSRLFSEVREKRGLAYNIRAMSDFHKDTGSFIVQAGVEHENLEKVIKIVLKEMKDIVKNGVTEEEFKRVKSGFAGRISFGYETSDDIAQRFGAQEVMRDEIILPEELLKRINKVSRAQIKKIAEQIFVNDGLNLAIIGPHKNNEESLQKILKL